MNDCTSSHITHILPYPPVAGASALPATHMGQGVFHGHALAPLRAPLGGLLAVAQLLQQGFSGMHADAAARRARGTTRPQRTVRTGGRGKLDHPTGLTRHRLSARTTPFVPFPIQMEGTFGAIWTWPYGPRLPENGAGRASLPRHGTGHIRPVDVPCLPGALWRGQVHRDRVRPTRLGHVG